MITEYDNIVSIEIAEELRDLGFDMLTHMAYFKDDGELYSFPNQMEKGSFGNNHILAPTQDVVAQWFRDVHNIDIEVHADVGMLGVKVYSPYVSTYEPKPLTEDEKEIGILTEEDVVGRVKQHKVSTRIPHPSELIPAHDHFEKYKDAMNAAILFAIKKLKKRNNYTHYDTD